MHGDRRTPRPLLVVAVLLALVLAGCGTRERQEEQGQAAVPGGDGTEAGAEGGNDTTLRVAIPDDVETLDPAFGQQELTNLVLKNVYAQPLQYEPGEQGDGYAYADTTAFQGRVLESWEFSDDRRTLTLKVREGVTFPVTGNPMDAQDFVWTMERALETNAGPEWVWGNVGVSSMDQVTVPDDHTVVLEGLRPSAITLPLLRDQTLGLLDSEEVQAHATDDDPWALEWLSRNYAGNGQYVVADWQPGTRMTLEANPEWWGDAPHFQTIELQVVPESANRLALLQNGTVDLAFDLSTQELNTLEDSPGVEVLSIPDRAALTLGMNTQVEPFNDVTVRQALAYAVPYEQIVEGVLQGRAEPAQGPMSVNSRFFEPYGLGELWPYEHDPERARQLLQEAGLGDGFSFDVLVPQGLPYVEETAANLRAAFGEVGVTMNIQPVSSASMAERLAQRDFQGFIRGWLNDYVDDPYYHFFLWWQTDTVLNWVGYSNPSVDAAIEQTAEVVEDEARRGPYREGIAQIIEDAPMLWLANGNYTLAMREDITGYVHHPDQLVTFAELRRGEET